MMDYKQKGNLDNYLIIEAEKQRFDEEKNVLAPTDTKDAYPSCID